MTPPRIDSASSVSSAGGSSTTSELSEILEPARLLADSSNDANPQHFAEQWTREPSFRTSHPELYLAIDALRRYFSQGSEAFSESQRAALGDWLSMAEPGEVERIAAANLRAFLEPLAASQPRAASLLELFPVSSEPETDIAEASEAARSSSFELAAISLGFRFDQAHRDLANAITIGALPASGVPGYNQAADFAWELDGEFTFGDFRFFGGVAFNHGVTAVGAPAVNFEQGFLQAGLAEYGNTIAGDRSGFFLGTGRSRVGIGAGYRVCTGLAAPEAAAGVGCGGSTAQLVLVNESDLVSIGYGPVELSIRLLSNPFYFNLDSSARPPSYNNLVPLEYSLIYHLTPPRRPGLPPGSAPGITDAQAVYDSLRLVTGSLQDHMSFRSEAGLEETRILNVLGASGTLGAEGQYNLLNLGSFVGGLLRGVPAGFLAYELRGDLAVGTTEQRIMLGLAMAAEAGIHGVTVATGTRSDPAIPALEEQAIILAMPHVLTRDSLSVLGAFGAFGTVERATSGDLLSQIHFFGAHGAMILGGLALVLASGDGSGRDFLANSILGNRRPALTGTDVAGTRWDLGSQREQYLRLDLGAMLLSYGASAILAYLGAPRPAPAEHAAEPAAETESTETASLPDLRFSLDTDGSTRVMLGVGGTF